MSDQIIAEIIEKIVADIRDRRGLKHEWNGIDSDVQDEIKATWAEIIKTSLKGG